MMLHLFRTKIIFVFFFGWLLNAQENITVIGGTGAVGSYFVLSFRNGGHDIHGIGSGDGHHFETIRQNGLKIATKRKINEDLVSFDEIIPASVFEEPHAKQDFILFSLKQPNLTAATAMRAIEMSHRETVYGVVANGLPFFFTENHIESVDPHGNIQTAFRDRCILGVMPLIAANITGPGETIISRELSTINVIIGPPLHNKNCNSETMAKIKRIFETSGISAIWTDNIQKEILKKEQFALTVNTLSALTGKTIDIVFEESRYQPFLKYGVEFVNSLSERLGLGHIRSWSDFKAMTITKGHHSSLSRDISQRKSAEIAAIVDSIIEVAEANRLYSFEPLKKMQNLLKIAVEKNGPISEYETSELLHYPNKSRLGA